MSDETIRKCPRCGGSVIYHGRGRRPVWCSTRCRNAAAVVRRGAREAAVEIRMIDVPKQPRRGGGGTGAHGTADGVVDVAAPASGAKARSAPASPNLRGNGTSAADRRALTAAVLADPEAVATVVLALTRLEQVGKFGGDRWAPVRAGIVSLADLIRAREA